jgi:hypothetical protein
MTTQSWIRSLFARPVTRPIRKVRHGARLALEALEDRTVPSRLIGPGLLDSGSVATPSPSSMGAFLPPTDELAAESGRSSDVALTGVVSAAPGQSGGPAPTGAPSYATLANGMPILNSHPGSPVAIFLDFNGDPTTAFGHPVSAYDEDGDPTTFNAVEQGHIYEAWREMTAYYGFFDVNVTTVQPAASVPTAWIAISNDDSGGVSFVGAFPNSLPESIAGSNIADTRVSGMAHEIGHNFGLLHQSTYDSYGNKVAEYASAPDPLHGPIMGVDYDGFVHKWFIGHNDTSPSTLQDDIAVIAAQIRRFEPTGGDGFLPDDFGNTIATATPLPVRGAAQWTPGVIERLTDVDAFSFTSTGGAYAISATPDAPSGVDLKLDIYAPDGTLLASSDGANNDQQLTMSLPAGTYYALVSSHGNYGDVGQYFLSVSPLPAGWTSVDVGTGVSGYTIYDGSTGTYSVVGTGTGVTGTSDGYQYAYQALTGDGTIVARVTNVDNTSPGSQVGVMVREAVAANAREVALVMTPGGGAELLSRSSTGGDTTIVSGTAGTFAPTWVKLVRSGSTFTGYTSPDGVVWTQLGTATVSMTSSVTVGLVTSSADVQALNVGVLDNVSVSGNLGTPAPGYNRLSAPTGLAVSLGTGTGLSLSWTGAAGATGYAVDRSGDGVAWAQVATTASGVTAYSDPGLAGSHRYFYRVSALDATGRSVPSAVASAVNRPRAVTGFSITSWTDTQLILNWNDTSGETGYRIERSTDGGVSYAAIATVGANVPSYTDGGLSPVTTYFYRVTPTSALGDGPSATATGSTRGPVVALVTSLLDDGSVGTLRWAVGQANLAVGTATITFAPAVFNTPQTITLTGAPLELSNRNATDTISGPAVGVTVSGGGLSRVFQVDSGVTASVSGMTITGGNAPYANGGGLANFGTLTLTNCTISGNSAGSSSPFFPAGGGVWNRGTLALTNCTVSGNSAVLGGGLSNTGTATLTNCTVSGNSAYLGGGLENSRGTATLTNCTVSGNSASVGGGLANFGGTATLSNCTVSGNSAATLGGGLRISGTTRLTDCTVSGNSASYGGGVFANAGTSALTDCTVSGNSAAINGGGVYVNAYATIGLTNCTVTGNSARNDGGGLFNTRLTGYYGGTYSGTAALSSCTVSGNSAASNGGGLYNQGTLTVGKTLVAGNTAASSGPDAVGTSTSLGHNLLGATDGSTGWVGSDLTGTRTAPLNPLLAPLGYYGGPTQTMPLLPGSPAIDAGTSAGAPASDQRGEPRVGAVDIGAFESQGFTIAVTSGGGQAADVATAFAAPLVATVTANNPSEPVAGGLVTFTPPSSGASAILGGSPATISAAGTASVTATANGSAGRYTVSATASGILTPASFSLANRPIITVPAPQTAYQNVDQPISGISIGDAPGATVTVTLNVGHGTLTLGTTAGLTVTGNGTGTLTLTGTPAALNAALATLVYRASHNYSGGDTLSLTATDSGVSATPAGVAITVESITQEATALQARVSALQTAGVLNQGQANSLIVKLNLKGNNGDIGKVQAFLNEVAADVQAGILTQDEAAPLLYWGNILLPGVTRR